MSALTLEPAMKVMQKNYHLVNQKTGDKVVVHPPRLPGLNKDFMNPKTEHDDWIRVFTVIEGSGKNFRKGKEIVLFHAPGEAPHCRIDNELWIIQVIPGVTAVKKRGYERKGYRGIMTRSTPKPLPVPAKPTPAQTIYERRLAFLEKARAVRTMNREIKMKKVNKQRKHQNA